MFFFLLICTLAKESKIDALKDTVASVGVGTAAAAVTPLAGPILFPISITVAVIAALATKKILHHDANSGNTNIIF